MAIKLVILPLYALYYTVDTVIFPHANFFTDASLKIKT